MAAVAVGGALGGVFAVGGHHSGSSVSLSANSHREHHPREMRMARGWSFSKLNNSNDPTFNQLLGINNRGQIAGYFGSGAAGHPNKGYLLSLGGFSAFTNENFPGGIQTQVIGINDTGVSVGFWSTQNTKSMTNNNFGFYDWNGQFHNVNFPTRNMAKPPVNQLLGVNDSDIAVGFFTGSKGNSHAYEYSIRGGWFHRVHDPRRGELDRVRHQQPGRHRRLLHRPRRRHPGLPARRARPPLPAERSRLLLHHGLRRQRQP